MSYVPSILIGKLVTPLMEIPKEVGNQQERVWPIACSFFLRKENYYSLDCKKNLRT